MSPLIKTSGHKEEWTFQIKESQFEYLNQIDFFNIWKKWLNDYLLYKNLIALQYIQRSNYWLLCPRNKNGI